MITTGAGTGGLASIPYQRGRIVRPLLDCDRAAIREYLTGLGQPWREDASNADTTRLRALVRAELVPIAERINPAFRETLARTMDLLADDDALTAIAASGRRFQAVVDADDPSLRSPDDVFSSVLTYCARTGQDLSGSRADLLRASVERGSHLPRREDRMRKAALSARRTSSSRPRASSSDAGDPVRQAASLGGG